MITTPLRILLVEDNDADILFVTRTLKEIVEAPQIEVVEDLNSCEERLINYLPDLVISDYNLPTCTGLEILQLVQEINPTMPFIFLTGTIDDEELAANTILSGAWAYILKRNMRDLKERLRPLLKKVVFSINEKEMLREHIRKNKITVNQIYHYLDNLHSDNKEHQNNIKKIKENLSQFNLGDDDEDDKKV